MILKALRAARWTELALMILAALTAALGFFLVSGAMDGQSVLEAPMSFLLPPIVVLAAFLVIHIILVVRRVSVEEILIPIVALLFCLGLIMIYRLRGDNGVWQQVLRGLVPGLVITGILIARPDLVEYLRRLAIPISLGGLFLLLLTAVIGVEDETGARLALRFGPLPAIQTSELIKLAMIIFLAWFVEREWEAVEGRARTFMGTIRLPALRYFVPGVLFVGISILALVVMSDWGAILILGLIFVAMLYAGFETRIFGTIAAIGLAMSIAAGLVLSLTWHVPDVIRNRYLAFRDPWSTAPLMINGQPTGVTISEGPGYQIQQAVYAIIAGGVGGTGLGYGSPEFVPLSSSDFIYAAIIEEMGAVVGIGVLILYSILLMRILRTAVLLPTGQVFERLLLVGIGVHLFSQVFVMVGGTLNLIPLTGVTVPFMSLGGAALMTNLVEIGIVLAVAQRLEAQRI